MNQYQLLLNDTQEINNIISGRQVLIIKTTGLDVINDNPDLYCISQLDTSQIDNYFIRFKNIDNNLSWIDIRPPFGTSNDIIFVREPHYISAGNVYYKADNPRIKFKWLQSIHMSKDNVRIWLKVKSFCIKRLSEINHKEIRQLGYSSKIDFIEWWDSIFIRRGYGFLNNPWIWLYEIIVSIP